MSELIPQQPNLPKNLEETPNVEKKDYYLACKEKADLIKEKYTTVEGVPALLEMQTEDALRLFEGEVQNVSNISERKDKEEILKESREKVLETLNEVSNECINVVRHAIAIKAETIIVLDKAARYYGDLFKKIIPIMRLEYAKIFGVDPDSVVAPKIIYVNPSGLFKGDNSTEELSEITSKKDQGVLSSLLANVNNVLIFDESSTSAIGSQHSPTELETLSIKGKYAFYNPQIAPEILDVPVQDASGKYTQVRRSRSDRENQAEDAYSWLELSKISKQVHTGTTLNKVENLIEKLFNKNVECHYGLSGSARGNLNVLFNNFYPDLVNKLADDSYKPGKRPGLKSTVSNISPWPVDDQSEDRLFSKRVDKFNSEFDLANRRLTLAVAKFIIQNIHNNNFSGSEQK